MPPEISGGNLMELLYEKIYRQKQEQYKLDGDISAFNSFIDKAHDLQSAVIRKECRESEYINWLQDQIRS